MKVYPWKEVIQAVEKRTRNPNTVCFQQFNCAGCGTKQTIDTPNAFSKLASCQECGHITNCEKDGINYMMIQSSNAEEFSRLLKSLQDKPPSQ